MSLRTLTAATLLAGLLSAAPLHAGGDHDHGHDHDAAPAMTTPALPRFAASSADFELVGVLDGLQLTLFLDRYADNAPVIGADLELDLGGTVLKAAAHDDHYEATLPAEPSPGVLPVVATVTTADAVDLLAGELDLHGHDEPLPLAARDWTALAGWIVAALLAVGWLVTSRIRGARA